MSYVDEIYYQKEYLRGKKPVIKAGFDFYASSASQAIDQYTFGRLVRMESLPEEVKLCCCELAEMEFLKEIQAKAQGGKTSEKVGTYSVSFASVQEQVSASVQEQRFIVLKWLSETGLCYQGVN